MTSHPFITVTFAVCSSEWANRSDRSGPGIRSGARIEADVYNIAPTVLYLMGLPVGSDMDGRPLLDALASPKPVRTALYTKMKHRTGSGDPDLDEKKLEELRSLGYIK